MSSTAEAAPAPLGEPRTAKAPRGKIHLIVNERAGRGRGAVAGEEAAEALRARGATVEKATTTGPGDAAELARRAREAGADVVAAVGGDGTLHEVVNGLLGGELLRGEAPAGRRPLLGQIPVGSGNDYAKMLYLPRTEPRLAADVLLDGPDRPVDVGILEGTGPRDATAARAELFLNNLGLAFAGDANARIESTRGLPGYLAYFVGALMTFVTFEHTPLEVDVGGRRADGRHTIVHVGLGRFCGGGVVFTPDALLDDGLFDVMVMKEVSRLQAAIQWKGVTTGQGPNMPDVVMLRGGEVVVRGRAGSLLHADGEVRKFVGGEIRARVAPRALQVICAKL